jgi:hypothetical protein
VEVQTLLKQVKSSSASCNLPEPGRSGCSKQPDYPVRTMSSNWNTSREPDTGSCRGSRQRCKRKVYTSEGLATNMKWTKKRFICWFLGCKPGLICERCGADKDWQFREKE